MAKICLVMIVKDEAHVLPRCLSALKPYIDSWVIVDTGSTDNTQEIIRAQLEGVPGEIRESPFESFRKNRTEALEFARDRKDSDYLLMIDADDTWIPEEDFAWPELVADGYQIKHVLSGTAYFRPTLTKTSKRWRYDGAAHEYMVCDDKPHTMHRLHGVKIMCGNDGARRKNEPEVKYHRVAETLLKEHKQDPEDRRTVFYLAQAYKDSMQLEESLKYYTKRSEMGGWEEETWFSLYQIGLLLERLHHPWKEAQAAYIDAYNFRPQRAEPLVALASLHRRHRHTHLAYIFAKAALDTPYPERDILFIDEHTYNWRALDEYAIAAQRLELLEEARDANLDILLQKDIPLAHRRRVEGNLTFSCRPIGAIQPKHGDEVVVVLATYQCNDIEALRTAVQSILDQTYKNLLLFVISDGDENPPIEALNDIKDSRMICIHLPHNMGQFAIYDAILAATDAPMFIVQDDDDVSHPDRIDKLVHDMVRTNADVVFQDLQIETRDGRKIPHPSNPEWLAQQRNWFTHAGSHVGLWKVDSLRKIGGYYGGFRIGADTLVVGIISRYGRPSFLRQTLYYVQRSERSMMTSRKTGMRSDVRKQAWADITEVWKIVRDSDDHIQAAYDAIRARISTEDRDRINNLKRLIEGFLNERKKTNENRRTGS